MVFARLHYPETLIENTIRNFIEMRVTENVCSKQQVSDEQDAPIRIVLPFKDQKSANAVRHQLSNLSRKINAVVQPVYVSRKIKGNFKPKEHKPPIVNQQNVVYYYKCGLCDTVTKNSIAWLALLSRRFARVRSFFIFRFVRKRF